MRSLASLGLLGILVTTGCYTYAPIESPRPGMDVRARLKVEAAVQRSEGRDEPIIYVDGRVLDWSDAGLSLDVLVSRSQSVFQDLVLRDTIQLKRADIQSIIARRISTVRTAAFVVAAGAGIFLAIKGLDQVIGGTDDPGDPKPGTFTGGRGFRVKIPIR